MEEIKDYNVEEELCCLCQLNNLDYTTECQHSFCVRCILMWCNTKVATHAVSTCPMCRRVISNSRIRNVASYIEFTALESVQQVNTNMFLELKDKKSLWIKEFINVLFVKSSLFGSNNEIETKRYFVQCANNYFKIVLIMRDIEFSIIRVSDSEQLYGFKVIMKSIEQNIKAAHNKFTKMLQRTLDIKYSAYKFIDRFISFKRDMCEFCVSTKIEEIIDINRFKHYPEFGKGTLSIVPILVINHNSKEILFRYKFYDCTLSDTHLPVLA